MLMERLFTLIAIVSFTTVSVLGSSTSNSNSVQSVSSTDNIEVAVYPNPAHNSLFIAWVGTDVEAEVSFYDALGTLVEGFSIENMEAHLMKVNTSNIQSGIYFVRISIGNFSRTERIVID